MEGQQAVGLLFFGDCSGTCRLHMASQCWRLHVSHATRATWHILWRTWRCTAPILCPKTRRSMFGAEDPPKLATQAVQLQCCNAAMLLWIEMQPIAAQHLIWGIPVVDRTVGRLSFTSISSDLRILHDASCVHVPLLRISVFGSGHRHCEWHQGEGATGLGIWVYWPAHSRNLLFLGT